LRADTPEPTNEVADILRRWSASTSDPFSIPKTPEDLVKIRGAILSEQAVAPLADSVIKLAQYNSGLPAKPRAYIRLVKLANFQLCLLGVATMCLIIFLFRKFRGHFWRRATGSDSAPKDFDELSKRKNLALKIVFDAALAVPLLSLWPILGLPMLIVFFAPVLILFLSIGLGSLMNAVNWPHNPLLTTIDEVRAPK
jgi:hypothetical protein